VIIYGLLAQPDRGPDRARWRTRRIRNPRDALALRHGMVHQALQCSVPDMTVDRSSKRRLRPPLEPTLRLTHLNDVSAAPGCRRYRMLRGSPVAHPLSVVEQPLACRSRPPERRDPKAALKARRRVFLIIDPTADHADTHAAPQSITPARLSRTHLFKSLARVPGRGDRRHPHKPTKLVSAWRTRPLATVLRDGTLPCFCRHVAEIRQHQPSEDVIRPRIAHAVGEHAHSPVQRANRFPPAHAVTPRRKSLHASSRRPDAPRKRDSAQ